MHINKSLEDSFVDECLRKLGTICYSGHVRVVDPTQRGDFFACCVVAMLLSEWHFVITVFVACISTVNRLFAHRTLLLGCPYYDMLVICLSIYVIALSAYSLQQRFMNSYINGIP